MTMTSNKPYLIRAMYDWIIDNGFTPYLLVDTDYSEVQVPQKHVVESRIVLNVSPLATRGLLLENDRIIFSARFSGKTEQIFVPPAAVMKIYARENGHGFAFIMEEDTPPSGSNGNEGPSSRTNRPALKVVK